VTAARGTINQEISFMSEVIFRRRQMSEMLEWSRARIPRLYWCAKYKSMCAVRRGSPWTGDCCWSSWRRKAERQRGEDWFGLGQGFWPVAGRAALRL